MTLAGMVARERRRLGLLLVAAAGAAATGFALIVLAAAAALLADGAWIAHPAGAVGAWVVAAAGAGAVGVAAWARVRAGASAAAVARAIESERGLRAGALRAAAEAAGEGALGARAAELVAAAIGGGGAVLAPAANRAARGHLRRAGAVLAAAIVAASAAAVRTPDGWAAVRSPLRAYAGTLLPRPVIAGAPRSVVRGDTVRVRVTAPGRARVTLATRATGAAWRAQEVALDAHGAGSALLGPLDADLALVATDGRARSDTVTIRVRDRAFVGDVSIEAVYPAYLARAPEALPAGEPARVPRGTVLRLEAHASTALAAAGLAREGAADTVRFAVTGRRAVGRLGAGSGGRWTWFARGDSGAVTDLPPALEVQVTPDAAPRAEILAPAGDTALAPSAAITLRLAATDDHGISRVALRSWRDGAAGASAAVEQDVASPGVPQWAAEVPLDLAPRGLAPGDALHVVLVATDDSPWRQTGESRALVIRIPTLEEQRAIARALADSTASRTAATARAERDLAQRTQEAARSRGERTEDDAVGPRHMKYESAERAAALAREQQQLAERVEQAQRDAAALETSLRAAGALDSSLARQLADVQKLLADAITPEMARQMEAVMRSAQKLSPEEARRALEQLAKQQERLREELERSAAMLRRAALEGAMETLRDDARELAAAGRLAADSLARRDTAAPRAAASVSERSHALADRIAALDERLAREQAAAAAARMPEAAAHARAGSQAMAQASTAPLADAARPGAAGAQELTQAADALAAARDAQVAAWKEGLTAELDRAASEAMELSQMEAALARQAAAGGDSTLRGQQSAVQQGVDRVQQRLQRAAGQSAHVSAGAQRALADAQRQVAQATREIAESRRDGRDAAPELDAASQALSQAAGQMMRDRAAAAGAQSASGFAELMQRMAELAKQQGGINAQAAGLLPMPGGPPNPLLAEQARALAERQRALARSLEEAGGGDAGATRMAREMRDIAAALDRGKVDPALLARQEQLFHRLLDSGLSMQKDEREDTGKRESRSADAAAGFTPANGAAEGKAAFRYQAPGWNELRGLTADERQAVLDYFRRLNDAKPQP